MKRKVRKTPRNVPERFKSLFSRLKVFQWHFFTGLHQQFQTSLPTLSRGTAINRSPEALCAWNPQKSGCAEGDGTKVTERVKVARLQSEFCTKEFFRATNFLTKNAPKFSPKFLSLCSVGQKKSRKIPSKCAAKFSKFPCEKSKNIHRRASAGAQEEERAQNAYFRRKPQIFTDSPLHLEIQAFGWRRKPQKTRRFHRNRRFSQKTAGNRRLGPVTLGQSLLARSSKRSSPAFRPRVSKSVETVLLFGPHFWLFFGYLGTFSTLFWHPGPGPGRPPNFLWSFRTSGI